MNKNKFMQKCKDSGEFNNFQMQEICWGFEDGLTMEQVEFLAKPKFNENQMCQIRYGFEEGLTMEEVKLYAEPKFNDKQMFEIRKFIIKNKNLSINTLKFLIQLDIGGL